MFYDYFTFQLAIITTIWLYPASFKLICKMVGSSLAASLELLAHL